MAASLRINSAILALLAVGSFTPAIVRAQCPEFFTEWGSLGSGDGEFNRPQGIATHASGDVHVCEGHNYRVQRFTSSGTYVGQWGSSGPAPGQLNNPRALTVFFGQGSTPATPSTWGRLKALYR